MEKRTFTVTLANGTQLGGLEFFCDCNRLKLFMYNSGKSHGQRKGDIMPILATFYGIIISMYFGGKEHLPPHFHAWYSGHEAEVDFEGNIIKGELPTRARNLLTAWVTLHSDELEAAWELCKNNELPPKIDPLR